MREIFPSIHTLHYTFSNAFTLDPNRREKLRDPSSALYGVRMRTNNEKKRELHSRLLLVIRRFKDGRLLLWPLLIQVLMLTMMAEDGDGHTDDDDDRPPLMVSQSR